MSEGKIVDLTTICNCFPSDALLHDIINRDNYLDAIEMIFKSGYSIVTVDGEEGIGKTVLLAQFAKRYPDNTISLFISGSCKWGYDPDTLRSDLCNQIEWLLSKKQIYNTLDVDTAFLRESIWRLNQYCRQTNSIIYFIIDGLDDIPNEYQLYIDQILDMLPFGYKNFYFILSYNTNKLPTKIAKASEQGSFRIPPFSLGEVIKFFSSILNITEEQVREIYKIFKKPGDLSSIKRILSTYNNIDDFIQNMPEEYHDIFELEWQKYSFEKKAILILGILAFDLNKHSVMHISEILGIEQNEVKEIIDHINFISYDTENQDNICFISESYKRFVSEKIQNVKEEIDNLIIDHLLEDPESEQALINLPIYYEKTGRNNDLISYLSPERFTELFYRSQSISTIIEKTELGIIASQNLKRDGDLIRFSLQKSIFKELDGVELWISEIEAHTALGDYDTALSKIQLVTAKEDRLHLLAIIAKKMKSEGISPDSIIFEEIQELHKQINYNRLGEKALEIASVLIHVIPDIAIEIVENTANSNSGENSLDLAFARLSFAKLINLTNDDDYETIDKINSKIKSLDIKHISKGIQILVGDYSVQDLIDEVEKIEGISEKLYFIRNWIKSNKKTVNAYIIIEYAIKLTVKSTEYKASSTLYRELAEPVPYIDDVKKMKELVGWFTAQKISTEKLGPPEDYIRLQLILAMAEMKYDSQSATNRVIETYFYICSLRDLVIKTECLSRLMVSIDKIDPSRVIDKKEGIISEINSDFSRNIEELKATTADHTKVFKRIIGIISKKMPNLGCCIANKLNTIDRRNIAFYNVIENNLKNCDNDLDLKLINNILCKISDHAIYELAINKIFERLSRANTNLNNIVDSAMPLAGALLKMNNAAEKSICICNIIILLSKVQEHKNYEGLINKLVTELNRSWKSIDIIWNRINVGFNVCALLANCNNSLAREYLSETEELKKDNIISSKKIANTYIACLRLTIRSFCGLIFRSNYSKRDIESINRLISNIPSYGVRCELWNEVALNFYISGLKNECINIVDEYIKPLYKYIPEDDKTYKDVILTIIAPSLYCAHQVATLSEVENLASCFRDDAYLNICKFILCKVSPSEPYDGQINPTFKAGSAEIIDICYIIEKMETDSYIYSIIDCICENINSNRSRINKQQQSDIIIRLENIIEKKLPNKNYIEHDGFKIIALAQIGKLKSRFEKFNWGVLVEEGKRIPNIADRGFILGIISSLMPSCELRSSALEVAKNSIETIPSSLEKVEHYKLLAHQLWNYDKQFSKECFEKAIKLTSFSNKNDFMEAQRNIIDISHRLDPEFASSLVSIIDDDEARLEARQNARKHLQLQKLKSDMLDMDGPIETEQIDYSDYSKNAWKLLGMLNSGRIETISINQARNYIKLITKMGYNDSYPILSWIIENLVKKFSNTDQVVSILRPLFDAIKDETHLFYRVTEKCTIKTNYICNSSLINNITNENELIRPGERDKALDYIKDWLETNLKETIIICDPFFKPNDMEILKTIRSIKPDCNVQILTSWKKQKEIISDESVDEYYRNYWRAYISEQSMPPTEITLVSLQGSNDFPIHDRWWITGKYGLQFGTSYNSLGEGKLSGIMILTESDANRIEAELKQYINRTKKEHNGTKLIYTLYTIY